MGKKYGRELAAGWVATLAVDVGHVHVAHEPNQTGHACLQAVWQPTLIIAATVTPGKIRETR